MVAAGARGGANSGDMLAGSEAFIGKVTGSVFVALARRAFGRQIKITSPSPLQTLQHPEPHGAGLSYEVRGTLKKLPRHHKIWLLRQDETSEIVWPQGFSPVQFDPTRGEWCGRIATQPVEKTKQIKIVAVVAPPTSCDLFDYYEKARVFRPLLRIPVECANTTSVEARVP
jgi:hypothetical protein